MDTQVKDKSGHAGTSKSNAITVLVLAFCIAIGFTGTASSQQVALTFDDLPAHAELPPGVSRVDIASGIVKALRDAQVADVYGFINAGKLTKSPADIEVLELWRKAGFPLGNHTYSHMSLPANTFEAFAEDIAANEPVLESLMRGQDWHWFRYPYLWEGETLEKRHAVRAYLKEHGYRIAQVTLDFEDYAWNNPYARCVARNDAAAIAWLKESYLSTAGEYVALGQKMASLVYGRDIKHVMLLHVGGFATVMLPRLLELLQQRGFTFVSLEAAQADPAYESDPDLPLRYGGSLLEQMMEAKKLPLPPHSDKPMKRLESICR